MDMAMGKVRAADVAASERHQLRQELLCALGCIQARKDFTLFLDLLTESEQLMLARRVHVAKRLLAGQSVREIRHVCNIGQDTIVAVDRWLLSRCNDYRNIFRSISEDLRDRERQTRRKQPMIPYTFRWVRKKYPLHFLLFNIFLDDIDWGDAKDIQRPHPYRPHHSRRRSHR